MDTKDDTLAVIYAIPSTQDKLFISANNKAVLLEVNSIPIQNRATTGIRIIDARGKNTIIEIKILNMYFIITTSFIGEWHNRR